MNQQALSSLIWSVADLLRGDFKQSEYGRVILPFTVLRRLDCVLAPTKAEVLKEHAANQAADIAFEPFVERKAGLDFYNVSSLDMGKLRGDQDNIRANLDSYIQGFAPDVRSIFEHFDFASTVERLHKAKLLYLVTEKFAGFKLHPEQVTNVQMGLAFEELIRKFAELSNETAGEHFTPREVIRLMVNLLFIEAGDALTKPGVVRTLYDPTAGTGGMLSVAGEYLYELNPKARLTLFGQELNPESHAICKADMLIRGQDISNIVLDNTLSDDGLMGKLSDYMLSNPPFGVEWKKIEKAIRDEFSGQETITVERPLRDDAGEPILGEKGTLEGEPQPDSSLRDTENVPLSDDVESYFKREVLPHAPDAWIGHEKTKVGFEIPFNRHFYVFEPPRGVRDPGRPAVRGTGCQRRADRSSLAHWPVPAPQDRERRLGQRHGAGPGWLHCQQGARHEGLLGAKPVAHAGVFRGLPRSGKTLNAVETIAMAGALAHPEPHQARGRAPVLSATGRAAALVGARAGAADCT